MNRKFLRATLIGLIALAALFSAWPALSAGLGLTVSVDSPQQAAKVDSSKPLGGCSLSNPGITFVVDFGGSAANSVREYCATGNPSNGWTAFAAAGLKVTGTAQYPVGFVCRINNQPPATQEDCKETPNPARGSWVYYTASAKTNNHGWQFSMVGATMNKPDCGDVQGWRFVKAEAGGKTKYPRAKPEPFKCTN